MPWGPRRRGSGSGERARRGGRVGARGPSSPRMRGVRGVGGVARWRRPVPPFGRACRLASTCRMPRKDPRGGSQSAGSKAAPPNPTHSRQQDRLSDHRPEERPLRRAPPRRGRQRPRARRADAQPHRGGRAAAPGQAGRPRGWVGGGDLGLVASPPGERFPPASRRQAPERRGTQAPPAAERSALQEAAAPAAQSRRRGGRENAQASTAAPWPRRSWRPSSRGEA